MFVFVCIARRLSEVPVFHGAGGGGGRGRGGGGGGGGAFTPLGILELLIVVSGFCPQKSNLTILILRAFKKGKA